MNVLAVCLGNIYRAAKQDDQEARNQLSDDDELLPWQAEAFFSWVAGGKQNPTYFGHFILFVCTYQGTKKGV